VILSPKRIDAAELRRRLTISSQIVDLTRCAESRRAISFCTVSAFKGLERDVVFLTGLTDVHSAEGAQLLYVGSSRARVMLAVFIDNNEREYVAERAREFGQVLSSQGSEKW